MIAQAYVEGISTRSVDDLVQAMGIASGISRSEVSRICRRLDVQVSAFKDRALGHVGFPYLFLDATYLKVRDPDLHQVVSKAVVVATGITTAGDREVLGLAVGDSEAETFWAEFLRSLRNRGLGGVRLVISDAHDGLTKAVRRSFQGASWQRCRVHFTRNVLAKVPEGLSRHGRRRAPHGVRAPRPRGAEHGLGPCRRHLFLAVPQGHRHDEPGQGRRARLQRFPLRALAARSGRPTLWSGSTKR